MTKRGLSKEAVRLIVWAESIPSHRPTASCSRDPRIERALALMQEAVGLIWDVVDDEVFGPEEEP